MATKKKATTKKTAAQKSTIRGGSARTAARDADTGLPPAGPLTPSSLPHPHSRTHIDSTMMTSPPPLSTL